MIKSRWRNMRSSSKFWVGDLFANSWGKKQVRLGGRESPQIEFAWLQDSLIVNLVKPFNVRVVLTSKLCPAAGEVWTKTNEVSSGWIRGKDEHNRGLFQCELHPTKCIVKHLPKSCQRRWGTPPIDCSNMIIFSWNYIRIFHFGFPANKVMIICCIF